MDARLEAEEIEEYFKIELPEGDFESVGGFIINLLGKIPKTGDEITYQNLKITVKSADERRIDKALITCFNQIPDQPEESGS